jgi:hypothetical protein
MEAEEGKEALVPTLMVVAELDSPGTVALTLTD